MVDDLLTTFNRYVKYGLFGGDQLPFNLFFYNKWDELPPVFNQITPLNNCGYNINKLSGLIIHCVSFGNGPWDRKSMFYSEWQKNYNISDSIDMNNIPNVPIIFLNEIETRSKDVVKVYLMGGTLNINVIIGRILQAVKILIMNPKVFLEKIKQTYLQR